MSKDIRFRIRDSFELAMKEILDYIINLENLIVAYESGDDNKKQTEAPKEADLLKELVSRFKNEIPIRVIDFYAHYRVCSGNALSTLFRRNPELMPYLGYFDKNKYFIYPKRVIAYLLAKGSTKMKAKAKRYLDENDLLGKI